MAIRLEQVQKLQQKLILSPQMQQAIQLLQLPLTELRQTAAEELMKNPLLEEVSDSDFESGTAEGLDSSNPEKINAKEPQSDERDAPDDAESDSDIPNSSAEFAEEVNVMKEGNKEDGEAILNDFKDEFSKLTELDDEWREYYKQSASFRKQTPEEEEKRLYFESSITSDETLEEHLKNQLNLAAGNERQKEIGEVLIGNLDDNGFLQVSLDEAAQAAGAPVEEVEKALKLIQTFHPVGVGSRNLKECLMLQLTRMEQEKSLAATIVENYLDLLAKKKIPQIAKEIGTTVEAVKGAAQDIEQLEPKPGRIFSRSNNFYPVPDVIVQKNEDEEYEVTLNNDRIPHLRISRLYRQLMEQEGDNKTKEYVRDKVKAGLWFIKNIQQRQNTIQNISNELVKVQKEFMDKGTQGLKPLTMQQVADTIGVHESTVSRAIANKYIQTPQGLYQMKYFFTGGVATAGGEATSTTTVKDKIQELIDNEDKKKPLADQEIIEILGREGIKLARRTVAKYRKELNILPSHLRKEY